MKIYIYWAHIFGEFCLNLILFEAHMVQLRPALWQLSEIRDKATFSHDFLRNFEFEFTLNATLICNEISVICSAPW